MSWGIELWDQNDNVAAHLQKGIEFCEKFSHFLKERCMIENEYASKLKRLVKGYQPKKKDEDCEFTCVKGFQGMIVEVHDLAGQHEVIAENLTTSTQKNLQLLIQQLKNDRKRYMQDFSKQNNSLQKQLLQLEKIKKLYEKAFQESEKARELFLKADADLYLSRAEVEKARTIMTQKQQVCDSAKLDYAEELKKTNEYQKQHYYQLVPEISQRFQDLEETRVNSMRTFYQECIEIEKKVVPIISRCIEGMAKAVEGVSSSVQLRRQCQDLQMYRNSIKVLDSGRQAEQKKGLSDVFKFSVRCLPRSCIKPLLLTGPRVSKAKDIRVVSDKYKSGFIPPSDVAFEDLGANGNAMEAASPTGSVQSLNPTEAAKPKPVKKKVFGIFGGSKQNEEPKEDFSHLPPNQQKKKLVQHINTIKSAISKEITERDALLKMQEAYRQNPSLGDPQTTTKQLEERAQKLDQLHADMHKFQTYLAEMDRSNNPTQESWSTKVKPNMPSNEEPLPKTDRQSQGTSDAPSEGSNTGVEIVVDKSNNRHSSGSVDSFEGAEEDNNASTSSSANLCPSVGMCKALYPFTAENEGSLSMTEGEQFAILERDLGDGWIRVRNSTGDEGFIPSAYVECFWNPS